MYELKKENNASWMNKLGNKICLKIYSTKNDNCILREKQKENTSRVRREYYPKFQFNQWKNNKRAGISAETLAYLLKVVFGG